MNVLWKACLVNLRPAFPLPPVKTIRFALLDAAMETKAGVDFLEERFAFAVRLPHSGVGKIVMTSPK